MFKSKNNKLISITWLIMIFSSILPIILFRELFNLKTDWIEPTQLIILIILLLVSFFADSLKEIRLFLFLIFILKLTQELTFYIKNSELWSLWFELESPNFIMWLLSGQLLRLTAAVIIFLILLYFKKKPGNFFIKKGDIDAEVKPIKWILKKPTTWKKFGTVFMFYISLGTVIFLLIAGGIPSFIQLTGLLKLLPFIVFFAVINAFYEELAYRASFLSVLEEQIGGPQSVYMTSVLFGIGHFYGVPYGMIGVLMATFLGYLLGKSMLETRGFFWAFLIHMVQDIIIFSFLALNMFKVGG